MTDAILSGRFLIPKMNYFTLIFQEYWTLTIWCSLQNNTQHENTYPQQDGCKPEELGLRHEYLLEEEARFPDACNEEPHDVVVCQTIVNGESLDPIESPMVGIVARSHVFRIWFHDAGTRLVVI